MRNSHMPGGPTAHQAAQDYRRMNNQEMIDRLGLPRVDMEKVGEAAWERRDAHVREHNCVIAIRRAIFRYLDELEPGH